ncbi:perforin-1-like isoform X2 [Parambassis ranga]|nr:perforin-1-like isoform X2 [Parambassis ranga]
MCRLWQLLLLCWAWSPSCSPSSMKFIGSPVECKQADFIPGYNLGGEGFDIVTMERKGAYIIDTETWDLGNGTCRMFNNGYLNGKKQKVPASVVDWRTLPKCTLSVSSTLCDSAETLANSSLSSVSNNWKADLDVPLTASAGLGGSHSREANIAMAKSKQDRYNFIRHSVNCNFYRYRMTTKPPLSHDFQSAVNSLPPYSCQTKTAYCNVIDTFGTHYITQVNLGGEIKAITSVRTCQAAINGLSETEVKDCLSVEASATFESSATIKAMMEHCRNKKKTLNHNQGFSTEFSERSTEVIGGNINGGDVLFQSHPDPSIFNRWVDSLKTIPDVVQYSLKPLHDILPYDHHARVGLKQEVEKYIKKNALQKKCSESCVIGERSDKRDPCACVCNSNQNIRSNCCPAGKGLATLVVYRLYAQGLYGDRFTETDGSVEVKYGDQVKRTAIIQDNDNPKWSEKFEFGPITINMANKLEFTVYDEDSYWNSDLLGQCLVDLRSGKRSDSCMFDHGTFFYTYEVQCAPSLSGDRCQEYIPSPMSSSLAKVFHTRNGVLAGNSRDQQCGVSQPGHQVL